MLLDPDGGLTAQGLALRVAIEDETDRSASMAWAALSEDDLVGVAAALSGVATAITDQGLIPFPNPMGLPKPAHD